MAAKGTRWRSCATSGRDRTFHAGHVAACVHQGEPTHPVVSAFRMRCNVRRSLKINPALRKRVAITDLMLRHKVGHRRVKPARRIEGERRIPAGVRLAIQRRQGERLVQVSPRNPDRAHARHECDVLLYLAALEPFAHRALLAGQAGQRAIERLRHHAETLQLPLQHCVLRTTLLASQRQRHPQRSRQHQRHRDCVSCHQPRSPEGPAGTLPASYRRILTQDQRARPRPTRRPSGIAGWREQPPEEASRHRPDHRGRPCREPGCCRSLRHVPRRRTLRRSRPAQAERRRRSAHPRSPQCLRCLRCSSDRRLSPPRRPRRSRLRPPRPTTREARNPNPRHSRSPTSLPSPSHAPPPSAPRWSKACSAAPPRSKPSTCSSSCSATCASA